jgi:hypothetical protein
LKMEWFLIWLSLTSDWWRLTKPFSPR